MRIISNFAPIPADPFVASLRKDSRLRSSRLGTTTLLGRPSQWIHLGDFAHNRTFVGTGKVWPSSAGARSLHTQRTVSIGGTRPMGGINYTTEQHSGISGIAGLLQTQMHGCVGSDAGWVGRKSAPNRHQIQRQQVGSSSSPNQPVVAPGGA